MLLIRLHSQPTFHFQSSFADLRSELNNERRSECKLLSSPSPVLLSIPCSASRSNPRIMRRCSLCLALCSSLCLMLCSSPAVCDSCSAASSQLSSSSYYRAFVVAPSRVFSLFVLLAPPESLLESQHFLVDRELCENVEHLMVG